MKNPKDLAFDDVVSAISELKAGRRTRWGASKKYVVRYEGGQYPPKAVLGLAISLAKGIDEWDVGDFSGGAQTNDVLRGLGLEVIEKGSEPR